MPQESFASVLSRLLSSERDRHNFFKDREAAIDRLQISQGEANALRQLDASAVEGQAKALISKRLRHIGEIIPMTIALQKDSIQSVFAKYANKFWPTSHRRHLIDALHFADWLIGQGRPIEQAEINRLRYRLGDKNWSIRLLTRISGRYRLGVQLLYNRRDFREWIFSIGF